MPDATNTDTTIDKALFREYRAIREGAATSNAVSSLPKGRAGIGRRVWGIVLGLFALGFAAMGLSELPDRCRWLGYVMACIFIPGSCLMFYVSIFGSAEDLQQAVPSLGDAASSAADGAAGAVAEAIFNNIG